MSRRETEFPNEPHTVGDLMSETAMAGEIGALCETLRDDLPLRIEYRMQAADALARLTAELARVKEERDALVQIARDTRAQRDSARARALTAEAALACVKQQCETAVYNISQRGHDETVIRSFQSIADYADRTNGESP